MEELIKQIQLLKADIEKSMLQLNSQKIKKDLQKLHQKTLLKDFWQDQTEATRINREIAKLEQKINPWQKIIDKAQDLLDLSKLKDDSLQSEINQQLDELKKEFSSLKHQLLFNAPYDDYDVIMSIFAGAGGTDAQDWADMLLRMYGRWVESKSGFKMKILSISPGEEAGIKSAEIEIEGLNAYGLLKGESGVHRLVRLSPFNADNLRQTSFAKVDVLPKIDKPQDIQIDGKDLKIDVYKSGGKGGQSVNTTDSAVRVTHVPTGVVAAIQNERSQLQNKEMAMTIVRSKLAKMQLEQHQNQINELKGPNEQAAWGNQIRNYVLHPYNMVKDLRTKFETSDTVGVLSGEIDGFIQSYLESQKFE